MESQGTGAGELPAFDKMAFMRRLCLLLPLLPFLLAAAARAPRPSESAGPASITLRAGKVLDGRGGVLSGATVTVTARRSQLRRPPFEGAGDLRLPGADATSPVASTPMFTSAGTSARTAGSTTRRRRPRPRGRSRYQSAENAYLTLMSGITTVQDLEHPEDGTCGRPWRAASFPGRAFSRPLEPLSAETGPAEQIRETVKKRVAEGADVIKIFASKSIREGGAPTMSQEQLDAACGEARAHHLRSAVHSHGIESTRRAVQAGCTSIEHGALLDAATLRLMAEHGTYFDPNIDLVFRNYFENRAHYIGIGSYTEEGFAQMQQAVPKALAVFKEAIAIPP